MQSARLGAREICIDAETHTDVVMTGAHIHEYVADTWICSNTGIDAEIDINDPPNPKPYTLTLYPV